MKARAQVALVNKSNGTLPDATLLKITQAVQRQVSQDLANAWGADAVIQMIGAVSRYAAPPLSAQVVILQNEEANKEAGYGDVSRQGKPISLVFVEDESDPRDLSVKVSAAILEMLVDPSATGYELRSDDAALVARDVCAPVLGLDYVIGGVKVSDFVLPDYFKSGSAGPFDLKRAVKGPYESGHGIVSTADELKHASPELLASPHRQGLRARVIAGHVAPSAPASLAAPTPPAREKPVGPARREVPRKEPVPEKVWKAPARQPDRRGVSEDAPARGPDRQPLRGIRKEQAEAAAAAAAEASKAPAEPAPTGPRQTPVSAAKQAGAFGVTETGGKKAPVQFAETTTKQAPPSAPSAPGGVAT